MNIFTFCLLFNEPMCKQMKKLPPTYSFIFTCNVLVYKKNSYKLL